ncbi:MAG TPA: proton-conducting transporter membrane subunit [Chitinophagales bacterium]|nr:proton-conducting transporter membrane subunit [Chitinophagales bacterium]
MINQFSWLIPLLPFAGFLVLGIFGRRYFKNSSGIVACLLLFISTILAFDVAYNYFFVNGQVNGVYQKMIAINYTWLQFSPNVSIDMGILLDPISVMMLVVITFVSLMVHIYSLGYMKGEERFATYYAFLSLFTFSMLGLVLSSNIFQIYIFWELVGISSYLLIGFYYDRPSAVAAAKKAFVVTRFADLGFLIGILILAFYSETLDFNTLITRLTTPSSQLTNITSASFIGISALTWGLTLVFIGGAGKSAMFPLHIWLPDAMEGPTPVSALIHAATMVVAGVYLVARLFPVLALSDPAVLHLIGYVGAFSALLAAVIACTQTDIKRVLAYSTMSQIGYMMLALGVSGFGVYYTLYPPLSGVPISVGQVLEHGYAASMFHLFTHAWFKSLLFLCAGAVIHLVHSNDMKDMGGLRKFMPITHITFLIACLAISGVPPFSGFFSKDEILLAAFHSSKLIYGIALFTSGLTAFYMFRLYFSIFWKKEFHYPSTPLSMTRAHGEGTATMKIPLVILAVGTLLVGFIPFSKFVSASGVPFESPLDITFSVAPVLFALCGIFISSTLYRKENSRPEKLAASLSGLYRTAYNKFYIDELYLFITKKIVFNLVGRPAAWFDRNIVDGFMNLLAAITQEISAFIKGIQSGKVQGYGLYFFAGIFGLAVLFIYFWK